MRDNPYFASVLEEIKQKIAEIDIHQEELTTEINNQQEQLENNQRKLSAVRASRRRVVAELQTIERLGHKVIKDRYGNTLSEGDTVSKRHYHTQYLKLGTNQEGQQTKKEFARLQRRQIRGSIVL